MLFYKIEATFENEIAISKRDNREEYDMFISELQEQSKSFLRKVAKLVSSLFQRLLKKDSQWVEF